MKYDLTRLGDTVFGKFLLCAMMSDLENMSDHDQSKLDFELKLDGHVLDFQKVFTAFEKELNIGRDGRSLDFDLAEVISSLEACYSRVSQIDASVRDSNAAFVERVVEELREYHPSHSGEFSGVSGGLMQVLGTLRGLGR